MESSLKSAFVGVRLHGEGAGLGADWDGGGGFAGFDDITALPKVTAGLKAAGYSDADLAKMWSGNVLRILRAAEDVASNAR